MKQPGVFSAQLALLRKCGGDELEPGQDAHSVTRRDYIRGLLCHTCNIAPGHIERRYAMARAYLDSPPVRLLAAAQPSTRKRPCGVTAAILP